MTGLTPKQESFCLRYIETGNASEAYRLSYDAEKMKPEVVWVKACELLKSGKVAVRVAELQEENRRLHRVTVESLTEEYEEARRIALEDRQASAAVSATTGKAKLHGLLADHAVSVNVVNHLPEQDKAVLDEYARSK